MASAPSSAVIESGEGAPWWLAGSLFAAWIVREMWAAIVSRTKNRHETDANIDLLTQLREGLSTMGARVQTMEGVQAKLSQRLDEEIAARMKAQEEAHRLRLRVQTLESTLKGLGAVIPPEDHML